VDTPAARALALQGARQGQVLLKNDNKLLPLDSRKLGKLALIGPHANGSLVFLGGQNYHGVNKLVDQYVG
jgi:beta-glucosidase